MIRMPRRSVTRFFIPLIDVLILLFCIFLLMEFNSESDLDKQIEITADQSESLDLLQGEVQRRTKELALFEGAKNALLARPERALDCGIGWSNQSGRWLSLSIGACVNDR